jgi:hypothetical protein
MVPGTMLVRRRHAIKRINAKTWHCFAVQSSLSVTLARASGCLPRCCSKSKQAAKSAKSCHFLCHRPDCPSRLKQLFDRRFGVSGSFRWPNCRSRRKRLFDGRFGSSGSFRLRRGTKRTKSATESAIPLMSFGLRIGTTVSWPGPASDGLKRNLVLHHDPVRVSEGRRGDRTALRTKAERLPAARLNNTLKLIVAPGARPGSIRARPEAAANRRPTGKSPRWVFPMAGARGRLLARGRLALRMRFGFLSP